MTLGTFGRLRLAALAVALTAATALHAQTAPPAPTAGPKPTRAATEEREVTKLVRELRKALAGEARLAAAKALGLLGDRSVIPVLTDAVRANAGDAFAYAALAELGVQPYLGDVTAAVRDSETPGVLFTTYAAALATRAPRREATRPTATGRR